MCGRSAATRRRGFTGRRQGRARRPFGRSAARGAPSRRPPSRICVRRLGESARVPSSASAGVEVRMNPPVAASLRHSGERQAALERCDGDSAQCRRRAFSRRRRLHDFARLAHRNSRRDGDVVRRTVLGARRVRALRALRRDGGERDRAHPFRRERPRQRTRSHRAAATGCRPGRRATRSTAPSGTSRRNARRRRSGGWPASPSRGPRRPPTRFRSARRKRCATRRRKTPTGRCSRSSSAPTAIFSASRRCAPARRTPD